MYTYQSLVPIMIPNPQQPALAITFCPYNNWNGPYTFPLQARTDDTPIRDAHPRLYRRAASLDTAGFATVGEGQG